MPIYHKYFAQRSAEWFRLRAAIPTASCFHKIVTPTGKASKQAESYLHYLLAEYVLGRPIDNEFQSHWMERGEELEESAVSAYEFQTGCQTEPCGLITTNDGLIGASPDRLVDLNGVLELKVPAPQTHIASLLNGELDGDHRCQVQGQLWISEREWCDIESFHPQMPPVITRVERDEDFIEKLSAGVVAFVEVMLAKRAELEMRFGPFVRPEVKTKPADDLEGFGITEADVDFILNHPSNQGGRHAN